MMKVSIMDLRPLDAWDYDWILVTRSYSYEESTHEIAYCDKYGDYVLFDGTEEEAYEFYSNYCQKSGLELVEYDIIDENEQIE